MIKRLDYIDVAKGLLILLVVIGHSNSPFQNYIFWFHMPAFFIISGYLKKYNEKKGKNSFIGDLKKFYVFFIPYISYFLLILFVSYYFKLSMFSLSDFIYKLKFFILGGTYLSNEYGTFWFITTLWLTRLLFDLIKKININEKTRILIIILLYFFGILLNNSGKFQFEIKDPWWSFRFMFVALAYYTFGYYFRQIYKKINNNFFINLSIFSVFAIFFLESKKIIFYQFNMKYGYHNNFIMNFVLPILLFFLIYKLSIHISFLNLTLVSFIGKYSLPIMYLHIISNKIASLYINLNWITYTLIGVIMPLTFFVIIQANKFTKKYFHF